MSKYVDLVFCELPDTPRGFDVEKFKAGDIEQRILYKDAKRPNQSKKLTYEEVTDETKQKNYARFVPEDCAFLDFDTPEEAKEMHEIIMRSGLKCLVLKTTKGYHFLFRKPDFFKKEMTGATNWFGYKFDTKASYREADGKLKQAVQIIRVCGMTRDEYISWGDKDLIEPEVIDVETLDVLPYWLWGKLSEKDLYKKGKPGESEYTLADNPFTQLMKMREGGRHNHIVERCSMFAMQNGFTIPEFKDLITAIHDQYLVKLGDPMPDSDLFGDLEERWEGYEVTMESHSWSYDEKERKWEKSKSKKEDKIDERRAAEYLFKQYDFYVRSQKANGIYSELIYRLKKRRL